MYKFFLYSMLMILYLGLAKTLSPSEIGVHYLQNEKGFSRLISNPLSTAILVDTHATGFLIKTFYQKYRIISGYDSVEEMIVRTSKEFAKKNLNHIGLSLYRRTSNNKEEFVPVPPGSLYIGNREFGEWRKNKEGNRVWIFHKSFKNFPKYLGWSEFKPDEVFHKELKTNLSLSRPFFGVNQEFGPSGKITRESFPHFFKDERMKRIDMKTLLIEYFKENF